MHYHGTPITPRAKLLELAGRCFCVSYASPRDVEVCHEIGQSVMLDNGAFTAWRQGVTIDWEGFYAWAEPWLDYRTTWAVIPDVIDGDEDANDALVAAWPFGYRGAPVWHLHEGIDRLERLCSAWSIVCIGSSGAYAQVSSPSWAGRMAQALDAICDEQGRPPCALHMLRGLALAGSHYPFASADSTNIARNHAGNHTRATASKSPRKMADEIDARQCPARWQRAFEQFALVVPPRDLR